jgi:hypothetical protein
MKNVLLTVYPSVKSHENAGVFEGSITEFASQIKDRPVLGVNREDKEKAPVLYPALFAEGASGLCRHDKDSVSEITGITLDVETSKKTGEVPPSFEEIVAILDEKMKGKAYLLYTTHSHTLEFPRWRLFVPFNSPIKLPLIDHEASLEVQKQQKETRALYFLTEQRIRLRLAEQLGISEDIIDFTKLNAYGASFLPSAAKQEDLEHHHLVVRDGDGIDPSTRWAQYFEEEKEKSKLQKKAAQSPSGPFTHIATGPGTEGLIAELLSHLPSIEALLIENGYQRMSDRFLAPGSGSGLPGVVILDGPDGRERLYSHHGPNSDPLSATDNGGHALDALDIITILRFGRDRNKALSTLGNQYGINRLDRVIKAASDSSNSDWGDPEELRIARAPADIATPYPIDALPPIMRDAVIEVAEETQAPLAMIAVSALCAASAALQGHINIQRKPGLAGPINIFALVIAMSGERKSTVDRFFARAISQWCAEQLEALKPEIAQHRAALDSHNSVKSGIVALIQAATKKGNQKEVERLTAQLAEHETKRPKPVTIPDMLLEDMTAEALVDRLDKFPVKYLRTAEGGNLFGGYSMNSQRSTYTLAVLNKAWDGDPINMQRKISSSANVPNPRLTASIMVQPQMLRNYLREQGITARGIGFLARFLVCEPISTQGTRFDKDPTDLVALKKFERQIRKFLNQPLPFEKGVLTPGVVILEGKAGQAWRVIHDEFEKGLQAGGPYVGFNDLASKAAEQVARIAAILSNIQHGLGAMPNEEDVRNAGIIMKWHMHDAMRIFSIMEADEGLSDAVELSRWLVEQCKAQGVSQIPRREIQRSGPSSVRNKEKLQGAILELITAGHVREIQINKQKLIAVNPKLLSARAS